MILVTHAAAEDLSQAAHVLARAFIDDPVMTAIVRPGGYRERRLQQLFLAMLRSGPHPAGVVDIARDRAGGEILGVAAWEAPGATRGATKRQLVHAPLFVSALGAAGLLRAIAVARRLAKHRPARPHWYLGEIGVAESARGKGVGTALLRSRLEAIDRTQHSAYLESSTPQNRRLYKRFGFEEHSSIEGIRAASPVAMHRPPAPEPL
ncbi:GNAT family N-acetyltransferase [Cellulosimicrobium cellulans]|uniref:GNAT family N-acetyltransferase n=1 Tax=Cellulosimicrobium cellulans TaxID=1710 RepID=UPI0036EE19B8